MIPASNVSNLMLKQEVVDAVKAGQFHILSVATIDDGIEVLTGMPAGRREDGGFSPAGVFARVDQRLAKMAKEYAQFGGEK